MVSKTQILHRYNGSVIYESDHQTVKECVEEAVKKRISLRYADLINEDLAASELAGADFFYADLSYSNLSDTNLSYTKLSYTNLNYTDLTDVNLTSAILCGCVGNTKEIKSLSISKDYHIAYTSKVMQIGCENHKLEDWWEFSDKRILEMDGKEGLKFWKTNKESIQLIIKTCPATPTKVEA